MTHQLSSPCPSKKPSLGSWLGTSLNLPRREGPGPVEIHVERPAIRNRGSDVQFAFAACGPVWFSRQIVDDEQCIDR